LFREKRRLRRREGEKKIKKKKANAHQNGSAREQSAPDDRCLHCA
jgi:hypothetical protein